MILAYFFPMWNIELEAPQYPEGLGLNIWINTINGDIDTINMMNHYIGMKYIQPEDFKELIYMPYIVGFLILFGLLTAIIRRRWMLYTFVGLLVVAGIAGGYDFYHWTYEYGHNLDPKAAIKVPGMSYQPPLIGSKTLLNFVAHSWPAIGGLAIIVAALGSLGVAIDEFLNNKATHA